MVSAGFNLHRVTKTFFFFFSRRGGQPVHGDSRCKGGEIAGGLNIPDMATEDCLLVFCVASDCGFCIETAETFALEETSVQLGPVDNSMWFWGES